MKTGAEIIEEAKQIFKTQWSKRNGDKVPEPEDLQLGNDAVLLEGTVLYADLVDSTGLVQGFKDWFAAEVYKVYLKSACYLIQNNNGNITAFDGDRVMAVYVGTSKNTSAAKTALQITYIVKELNSLIKESYPSTAYTLRQSLGIDTSAHFIARTGVRKYNDLVWVGRSANYASKLCGLADPTYPVHITEEVFGNLSEETKYGGNPRQSMWEKIMWQARGIPVYRSSWYWKV